MSASDASVQQTPRDARGRNLALPAPLAAKLWQPGQSGNPSGKGGKYWEALKIARDLSPEAATKLGELMHDSDPRVAVVACNAILDRAWGKPKEFDPKSELPALAFDPSQLSDRQREAVRRALLLLLGTAISTETLESEPQADPAA